MRVEFPENLDPAMYTFGLPKGDVVGYTYCITFKVPPSCEELMDWHLLGALQEAVGGEATITSRYVRIERDG